MMAIMAKNFVLLNGQPGREQERMGSNRKVKPIWSLFSGYFMVKLGINQA